MSLIAALEDLKAELTSGRSDVDAIVSEIAEGYDLKPVFLKNRAVAVLGDLETFASRNVEIAEATRLLKIENDRKVALAKLREKIDGYNLPGADRRFSLPELVEKANALGANYVLRERRAAPRRRELSDAELLSLINALLGDFKKAAN